MQTQPDKQLSGLDNAAKNLNTAHAIASDN